MHVSMQGFVLFLHIAFVIGVFFLAGFMHVAFHVTARTRDRDALQSWAQVVGRIGPVIPLFALGVLLVGAWLVGVEHSSGDASFSDGWVVTGIVALVLVEGLAGAQLEPRLKRLTKAVEAAPAGAVSADVHALTVDPVAWGIGHTATFGFLGVVYSMAAKPSGGYAWIFPVVGALIGVALSQWQLSRVPAFGDAGSTLSGQPSGDGATARAGA